MPSIEETLLFLKQNFAAPLAAVILSLLAYTLYRAFNSARDTQERRSTSERLSRLELILDGLAEGTLSAVSRLSDVPVGDIRSIAKDTGAGTPNANAEERSEEADADRAFYESRGYRLTESPGIIARRLLEEALGKAQQDISIEQALSLYRTISDQQNRVDERTNLRIRTEQQLASSASTKTSMIWLFLGFNLAVIFSLVFTPAALVAAKELVLGLYVSMAMFIVYVFRSSNARALTLLAITEDLKRYHDAEKYMNSLRPGSEPTDQDVEILRMILANRAEREKGSEHPYELILKGISNSTILFKGGKVSAINPRADKSSEDK